MIVLYMYMSDDAVVWSMHKPRPASQWLSQGVRYWERSGLVKLEPEPTSDRELLTAALKAINDRLGEREHLGGGGV